MNSLADQLLVLCLLINFAVLGTSRLTFSVRAVALQGVLLGVLPALVHPFSWHLATIVVSIIAVKGAVIPILIIRAVKKAEIQREFEPFIGYIPSLVLGAIFTSVAFIFATRLPLAPEHEGLLFVPASLATLMCGFLVLMGRRKAISQVIGYLLMENGIFIFGLLLAEAMPVMVEAGALLDLLVGVFVMGIVINHISREFSTLDTSKLSTLREG
ncbi:NADH-quinone oxidoreductase subunit K [Geomonas sp.]|uniref:NADH-quinone oxidoreductase subunit K n=1 Tax=Geomonas sp. TaxID=2651584 RepID=UPI002B4A360F|nr:NADH-quinone oxidoreductase subunit K [Geomonas sp.]HJV34472.1 NADH-quinone oxidoreductase subunit K [Geomonas sp.]